MSWTTDMVYVGNSGQSEEICKYPRQWTGHSEERRGGYGNKAYLRETEYVFILKEKEKRFGTYSKK